MNTQDLFLMEQAIFAWVSMNSFFYKYNFLQVSTNREFL